jgi:D-glycero-D-manno-heptose 1,7-bisphosphate phosphatase
MMSTPAVFLDLQGTLGGEGLGDIIDFSFFPGAVEAIRQLNQAGLLAIIITNQSHISKGILTQKDFEHRMGQLKNELAASDAHLDAVYCCPHSLIDGCNCRKPLAGMLLQARQDFDLELNRCYVVGDTGAWDMALANTTGCAGVLVRTGLGESSLAEYRHTWQNITPDYIADDILTAVSWILQREAGK